MLERVYRRSLISGSGAALTSTLALAVVAVAEGAAAAQPLNATSHWLNGNCAARRHRVDIEHTGVGVATHWLATIFWAFFFEVWAAARPTKRASIVVSRAATVSALAAVVDYTITPRRFTPGWELVISRASMGVVYATMAAGLAGVALVRPADR